MTDLAAVSTLTTGLGLAESRQVTATERLSEAGDAKAAAREFEAMFLAQMLGHMFEGIAAESPFGGGHSERIYRSLMMDAYAREITRRGGIGIADAIHQEILKLQEAADDA